MDILEQYKKSFMECDFINANMTFAFGEKQLQEAMQKLGAKDTSELCTIFGAGDVCLKINADAIIKFYSAEKERENNWLKSLSDEEKEKIIRYELSNHECTYTWNIEPVLNILADVFDEKIIYEVWRKVKKEYEESED